MTIHTAVRNLENRSQTAEFNLLPFTYISANFKNTSCITGPSSKPATGLIVARRSAPTLGHYEYVDIADYVIKIISTKSDTRFQLIEFKSISKFQPIRMNDKQNFCCLRPNWHFRPFSISELWEFSGYESQPCTAVTPCQDYEYHFKQMKQQLGEERIK